ncbi:MAG: hypothetical protein JWP96_2030 [Polaromonas sp.]|nr:hypothetical protein [Polaromonas sp.]
MIQATAKASKLAIRCRPLLASLLVVSTALALGAAPAAQRVSLPDPLDIPTQPSVFASKGLTTGIARQGNQLIAVGPRGLILVSNDAAATWKQVTSPVSSDLVSVKFTGPNNAWAVGHDAVALHTTDGGVTWKKVLDGRSVLTLLRNTYTTRATAGNAAAKALLPEIERSMAQSATPDVLPSPFLDVWFANANEGYLVGAFGLVLRTIDGGNQWEPWIEQLDNPRSFHLYAVTGDGAQRYIAGEQGLLLRLDAASNRFVKVETPYAGTYFGLNLSGPRLVAFGLRGNAYVQPSPDAAWNKIETGVDAHIVSAVNLSDEHLILVSQAGHVLDVSPDLRTATVLKVPVMGEVLGAVANGPKRIALARLNGVGVVQIGDTVASELPIR